jgi:hypothetical protein
MKKIVYVLAILAAASTAAVAKDLKQDKKAGAPTVAAAQMTDAEMDKVTAGDFVRVNNRGVFLIQDVGSGGQSDHRNANQGFHHSGGRGACFNCGT